MVPCNLLFPCLDGLSSPFPAEEKFTGAIPAKFASLSAFGNLLMSPISESSFATVVSLTPEMVFRVHSNLGGKSVMALSTSSS